MTRHDARQAIRREDGPCHVPLVIPMKSKEYSVRGAPDFAHTEKNCAVSMVCPIVDEESSCSGEGITRTKEFIKYIPEK